jgi:hypothetical protein
VAKLSLGNRLFFVPSTIVRKLTKREADRWAYKRAKLTPLQHQLQAIVVRDLPGSAGPLTAATIAERAEEPVAEVEQALADLHTWLGFIALDDRGAVEWAYPVTVANTPHHLAFESGERMSGA